MIIERFFPNIPGSEQVVFSNTLLSYLEALVLFAVLFIIFAIFQRGVLAYLAHLSNKTHTDIDDTLVKIVRSLRPPFYSFLAFFLSVKTLTVVGFLEKILIGILIIWIVAQVITATQILIEYVIRKRIEKSGEEYDEQTDSAVGVINTITKIVLWAFGLLFILSNFGVEITSLIAGLGIGGIAIAFALQNILSDLFSSFAIYFDKPFQVGDFIIVGDKMGTVEAIGIKTTRVRALQGEEIVFANKELTNAEIRNFKKMEERRVAFSFGVTYDTPTEKMKQISPLVSEVFSNVDARLDRVHFHKFGDSALLFECVYYVSTPEYNIYMDINQAIHLGIKDAFEKEGIEMAFPTQTIYLSKD